jgi:hypothetical protein
MYRIRLVLVRSLLVFVTICVSLLQVSAQSRKTVYDHQAWFQYFLNARVSEKFSVNLDGGYRTSDWFGKNYQYLLRSGLTYHINKKQNFQAGVAYFTTYSWVADQSLSVPEIRGWQRFNSSSNLGRIIIIQRYRLEERFIHKSKKLELVDGYKFNFRATYHLGFQLPLNKKLIEKGTVFLQASNEIFINFGSDIVYNVFDQERIFGGLGYQFTDGLSCVAGYQQVWQQKSDGLTINDNACIRLSIIHNIDFRNKE